MLQNITIVAICLPPIVDFCLDRLHGDFVIGLLTPVDSLLLSAPPIEDNGQSVGFVPIGSTLDRLNVPSSYHRELAHYHHLRSPSYML
ncbi:hypothetical protein SUGI_0239190 [Cryptomeria japonica]|nr:hypothetical protein SUGI_0239190 [Cryptomeria japonica]